MANRPLSLVAVCLAIAALTIALALATVAGGESRRRAVVPGLSTDGHAASSPTGLPDVTSTATPGGAPIVGGCDVFPADSPWNTDISRAPVDPNSDGYMAAIEALGGNQFLHPDFGSFTGYGIPYVVVPESQPLVPITLHGVRRRE